MKHVERERIRAQHRIFRYGIAAIALSAGLACAPEPGVAWADSTDTAGSGSTSDSSSNAGPNVGSTGAGSASAPTGRTAEADRPGKRWADRARATVSGPKLSIGDRTGRRGSGLTDRADSRDFGKLIISHRAKQADLRATDSPADAKAELDVTKVRGTDLDVAVEKAPAEAPPATTELPTPATNVDVPAPLAPADIPAGDPVLPELVVTEPDPSSEQQPAAQSVRDRPTIIRSLAKIGRATGEELGAAVATLASPGALPVGVVTSTQTEPSVANPADSPVAALVAVTPSAVETSTPTPPQPLSPVAQLLQLPGRVVNAVLEVFDFTSSANSPTLPVSLVPINDLIFGAFREVERLLGLHQAPPPQPVVPTLIYDGPTDRLTPTVAQFLNASTAAYVLGSTPGDLKPFVVNGHQMSSTNLISGMVGKAWVTPEGQIIIAYQGTTGGTHLLFNPIIVIPQVIADLQVVFTGSTPLAFHDALDFAEQVQAEAALQGYSDDDIFVTGHSLGGWEAQYVAQQTGLSGIGFEAPGINTTVPGNGADSMFINIGTYGSSAPYMSTDLPGLQPFMPPYVPGGGSKPHYGPIVMIGDPAAMTPLYNASALWGKSLTGSAIFLVDYLMNFFQYHLPGVQAYHLDITSDPGVVPFLGTARGPVHTGYGDMTIPELMAAASNDGILFQP